ncbi:hypothetical protein SDJN02_10062, partial [Cucurbita argyrosperma subsp. argyrosperma]
CPPTSLSIALGVRQFQDSDRRRGGGAFGRVSSDIRQAAAQQRLTKRRPQRRLKLPTTTPRN